MKNENNRPEHAAELRKRAEEIARGKATPSPKNREAQSPEAVQQTLHELRVHQIELELQNEELRQAQLELEVSRARYFDFYDLAPAGFYTISEKGLILEANLTAATMLGVSRGALVKQPISRFILKEDQNSYFLHRKRLFETGEPQACDLRMLRRNGTQFWARLEAAAAQDATGTPEGRVVMSDITERKQAEETLRRQQTLLQNMERIGKVGGWEYDITAKRMTWTDELYRIYGVSPATYDPNSIQKNIAFYAPEDQATITTAFQRASEQGEPYDLQLRFINATGKQRWVRTIGQPEFIEGRVMRVHGNFMDITESKQAREIVRQLQKAESLGRMAGAIAHHFNNQLGAVMGNLELAMVALPQGTGAVANLTEAMQATRRAAEVSGLMLTYLGQTRGQREPIDLFETCRRSLPMLQAAVPFEVVLETDLPLPGPAIHADANQIQQVLTNLCTNAWEAVGDGRGGVHLIVKAVSAADIPAAPRFPLDWQPQKTTYVCLEVADAGCGIAGSDIEKLFDPFFSTKFAGRGLGLSVVLGIVRTHGGVITVQSEPGHGSVFRIFFPVSTEVVLRPPEKAAGAPEFDGGGTVLLVEDLDMLRDMVKSILELLGFSVLEARDGVEALEVFRQHPDDIRFVLCDLTMPRMDGWETLAALRSLAPGIPVILTSGYNEAQVMDGVHPTLPEAFLSKPYGFKELREAIARVLADKKKSG